jgi:predicted nucleic acid-binding protein
MSGNDILLDTNVLIYLSQGRLDTRLLIEENKRYFVSLITAMELLSYRFDSEDEEALVRQILSLFEIIEVTLPLSSLVAQLRRTQPLKLPDAIIAATAHHHDLTLITNDQQLLKLDAIQSRKPEGIHA